MTSPGVDSVALRPGVRCGGTARLPPTPRPLATLCVAKVEGGGDEVISGDSSIRCVWTEIYMVILSLGLGDIEYHHSSPHHHVITIVT